MVLHRTTPTYFWKFMLLTFSILFLLDTAISQASSNQYLPNFFEKTNQQQFDGNRFGNNQLLSSQDLFSLTVNGRKMVQNAALGSKNPLRLRHQENTLVFEFADGIFEKVRNTNLRYRLKGFDENWAETSEHPVRYTHLPTGKYTFQLMALDQPMQLTEWSFDIRPPWWASRWAYLFYTMIAVGVLGAFLLQRRRQQHLMLELEQEHQEAERLKGVVDEKSKCYTDISNEFRSPLTVILGMVKQIKDDPKVWYSEGMQMIERNGRSLLQLVKQMPNLSKLEPREWTEELSPTEDENGLPSEANLSVTSKKKLAGTAQPSTIGPILLLVANNSDLLRYLQSFLSEKYQIEVAFDARKGLKRAIELVPDIVISDTMLSGVDSAEFCEMLKKEERTCHVPIILLTQNEDASCRIDGQEYGADAYLTKPFDKEEMLVWLRKLLTLRKTLHRRYSNGLEPFLNDEQHSPAEDELRKNLLEVLGEHYTEENFDITEICRALNMSRAQCYRKISALTGEPVAHLLQGYRLGKAKGLLLTSSLSISQVALEVGFKNLAHFSRCFHQKYGISASGYRKRAALTNV